MDDETNSLFTPLGAEPEERQEAEPPAEEPARPEQDDETSEEEVDNEDEEKPIKKNETVDSVKSHTEDDNDEKCVLCQNTNSDFDGSAFDDLVPATKIYYDKRPWLLKPYIAIGTVSGVQGAPGIGKTTFICGVAANISTGKPLVSSDGTEVMDIQTPGNILMITAENDLEDLKHRFEGAGGNPENLFFFKDATQLCLADEQNIQTLEERIMAIHAKLIIFDPIQTFFTKIDINKSNQTRPILDKLTAVAKKTESAIVFIMHVGKSSSVLPGAIRSLGSVDIAGSCRSILHVKKGAPDRNEVSVYHEKSNLGKKGKTIVFSIVGDPDESGYVKWERFTTDTLESDETTEREAPEKNRCKDFILAELADGAKKSKDLDDLLKDNGFARSTINRAKAELKKEDKIFYYKPKGDTVYYTSLSLSSSSPIP